MSKIDEAIQCRKNDEPERALEILKTFLQEAPEHPQANYQAAWTCDQMGKESLAAPYYEKAIENGLTGEERRGALLGLGSTYRCLGEYQKSLNTFDRAIKEFPEDRAFKVFRALTLYNLGESSEAVGELLVQLLETTKDEGILAYEGALRFYSDKLDQTWVD